MRACVIVHHSGDYRGLPCTEKVMQGVLQFVNACFVDCHFIDWWLHIHLTLYQVVKDE